MPTTPSARSRARKTLPLLLLIALPGAARADMPAGARFSGVMWTDWFYNASGVAEDSSAFDVRRVYLTFDDSLDARFALRVQLEADGQALTANGRTGVLLKQACLQWKDAVPGGTLVIGQSSAPLWFNEEALWGYRSIEKTALDLRGLGNATDLGVALAGSLPGWHRALGYHLMLSNGSGTRPENDRSRRATAAIALHLGAWIAEPVADWEGAPGEDRWLGKLMVGWSGASGAFGVEAFRRQPDGISGLSAFARAKLSDRVAGVVRYDRFDSQTPGAYFLHEVIAGADFALSKQVHLIPNVLSQFYEKSGGLAAERDADVVPRVTLAFNWP